VGRIQMSSASLQTWKQIAKRAHVCSHTLLAGLLLLSVLLLLLLLPLLLLRAAVAKH